MEKHIKGLVEKLEEYNLAYHNGSPIIDDSTYDIKKQELQDYVNNNPEWANLADKVLNVVGSTALKKGFQKAKHKHEMLSLDAVYDVAGYQKWIDYCTNKYSYINSVEISAQPKLDGLSIELIYEGGVFTQAITRGDGKIGEDVTENIKATGDIPLTISGYNHDTVSVIGEVIIHKSDFDKYLSKDFSNPRNAAVGSLKQLDVTVIPSRHLKVYVFDIKTERTNYYGYGRTRKYSDKLDDLKLKGFRVIPFYLNGKITEASTIFKNMTIWRDTYDVEMDGVVFKIDDSSAREQLGNKSTVPVWAIAWKFNSMVGESEIEDVNWSMSKYGNLTPVARVKEVNIGGVNITNVNLHNYEFATKTLDIRIGDVVTIRRAGDVIPEIVSVDTLKRKNKAVALSTLTPPPVCPYCNGVVGRAGLNVTCISGHCKEQTILKLKHFCAKEAMNVEGLSTETLRVLVEQYGIEKPKDLYTFDFHKLNGKAGFGAKKIANIEIALHNSKKCEKAQFMYSMSIPDVGRRASIAIIDALEAKNPSMGKEWYELTESDVGRLRIANIGNNIAQKLGFWNSKNKDEAEELMAMMDCAPIVYPPITVVAGAPLAGEKILFTGALTTMGQTRSQATELVERLGGITTDSMSTATILIVGDKPGSKLAKGQAKGLRIMYETEFETMCQDNDAYLII